MDAEALRELFAPLGPVTVRRMFGGAGIYADGLCFAIQSRGDVYLKSEPQSESAFAAAGSQKFVYEMQGKPREMGFWRLPDEAYDDPEALKRWAQMALAAARRAAAAKASKRPRAAKRR